MPLIAKKSRTVINNLLSKKKERGMGEVLEGGAYFKCWPDAMGCYLKGSRLCAQPLLSIKKKRKVGVTLTQRKTLILNVEVILGALI